MNWISPAILPLSHADEIAQQRNFALSSSMQYGRRL
jgi:hypothetical protein